MSKHTPGPWVQHSLMVTEADWTPGSFGKGIAHCGVGMRSNADLNASEANARFIAASPAMYEALLLCWRNVLTEYHDKNSYVRRKVEEAMAQASPDEWGFLVEAA